MEKKKQKKKYKGLKIFGKILLGFLLFILLLLLFIRSPWGQGIIVDEVIAYIEKKTNTEVKIDKLFITFSGNVNLEGLYLEDTTGDTLIYSRELEADIGLWSAIRGNGISVDYLQWEGVRANVVRQDTIQGFNYEFLTEAFATTDTTATAPATPVDTAAASQPIELGELNLNDFDVDFVDAVTGVEAHVDLGSLMVEMQTFDLDSMNFEVTDAQLANTQFQFTQRAPTIAPDTTGEAAMPLLALKNLELNDVEGTYESIPDGMLAEVVVSEFLLEMPQLDMVEKQLVIDRLVLNQSEVLFQTTSPETAQEQATPASDSTAFQWPVWNVEIAEVSLKENELVYLSKGLELDQENFNPGAFELNDLNFVASAVSLENNAATANFEEFSFSETSGFTLYELAFEAEVQQEFLQLDEFILHLNENLVRGNLTLNYDSLDQFLTNPENAEVAMKLPEINLNLKDLFKISPELRQNEYLQNLSQKKLTGQLQAEGTLASLQVEEADFNWGRTTSLTARGELQNLLEPENLQFDFPRFQLNSNKSDLYQIMPNDSLGFELPQELALQGSFQGNMNSITTDAVLNTSEGEIAFEGSFSQDGEISFNGELTSTRLDIGSILNNEKLGELSLSIKTTGKGSALHNLDAKIDAELIDFEYNGYNWENIKFQGQIQDGEGVIASDYKDENLNMELRTVVELDSVTQEVALNLNVVGADLGGLGITARNIRVGFILQGTFAGTLEEYNATAEIVDGVTVYDNESYLFGDFGMVAHVRTDSTAMDISSEMLDLELQSNTDPATFSSAVQRHFLSYFAEVQEIDTVLNPVHLKMKAEIRQDPVLSEVFLVDLVEMDTVDIAIDFHERERDLAANVELPYLNFNGYIIDSLSLELSSDNENLAVNFGFDELLAGPLEIQETVLKGAVVDEIYEMSFTSKYQDSTLLHFESELTEREDTLRVHINPEELVMNSSPWEIPLENEILIGDNFIDFNNFRLTRNDQLLQVSDEVPEVTKDHVGIRLDNFKLASFLSYLNPDEILASGRVNGEFIIEEPFGSTGLIADLGIDDFHVMQVPLGNMVIDAEELGNEEYRFDMAIVEGDVDLELTGNYRANDTAAQLDMDLNLIDVKMAAVEGFLEDQISGAKGSFSGEFEITGTTAEPIYNGEILFNNAGLRIAEVDAPFTFPDEVLRIDNEGLYLDEFEILDNSDNVLTVSGSVLTESFLNPEFALDFQANDFMFLNSTSEDNELFYGTASVDVDAELSGTLNVPVLEGSVEIGPQTNFTYVIPETELEIEERDGVVIFVNRNNPDKILTERTEEEVFALSGLSMHSIITVDEEATMNVIIDQETGDQLQVQGEAELIYDMSPTGRTSLTGRFVATNGFYEMSLYNLVSRRFEIVPGSTITWAGDPLDATLDVTALYEVEAAVSSLMATRISGADIGTKQQFRQELPFLVYLVAEGELLTPQLSFNIELPEAEQGALGGQVYAQIQQLNQQEAQLNKQVFSLLVLNRFFPTSGAGGGGGGTAGFARENLNRALSDQLNMLSGRLLSDTGVNLNFGLDSFTDYQGATPEQRTQLDISAQKSFMNDRLIVEVGSQVDIQGENQGLDEPTPVIGNVSISYLLTENGRWQLEAFRESRFENVIDGQMIVSGIALIFTREFNKFKELWDSVLKKQSEETVQEE